VASISEHGLAHIKISNHSAFCCSKN